MSDLPSLSLSPSPSPSPSTSASAPSSLSLLSSPSATALTFMNNGYKILNKKWYQRIFETDSKYEDAFEMFIKAANTYKKDNKLTEAGQGFCEAAECQISLENKYDAAKYFTSAAECYKKNNIPLAIICLQKASEISADDGRFINAAKKQQELGEIYETNSDIEEAIAAYQTASDWYEGDNQTSDSNKCLLKIASLSAELTQYSKAIDIYESVALSCIGKVSLVFSCKNYYFNAGLCHLCTGDIVGTERALQLYQQQDTSFSSTRECRFLIDILEAYKLNNSELFTDHVKNFDSLCGLDKWKVSILLNIKKSINNESLL